MKPARAVLLLPALAFAAGIFASSFLHPETTHLCAGLPVLALLWLAARRHSTAVHRTAGLAVMLAAGSLTAELHRPARTPELNAAPGEVLFLSGCIAGPVASNTVQSRFVLELEPGARVQVTLTAREGESLPSLHYGQRAEVEARIRMPRNFRNPGSFDYVRFLGRQQIYWTATARGVSHLRILPGACGAEWRRQALAVREAITARVHALYPRDPYMRQVLPALLTGDDAGTERNTTEDYRRTGTYHALVVSGLHITVIAGSVRALMRVAAVPLGIALLVPAVVAWLYAGVVNWDAPVVRSAAGFTLFLLGRWYFREGSILNLLAAVALALLVFDPDALFDAGFQLTFLSVAAIGGLASPAIARTTGPYADGLRVLGEPSADHKLEPFVRQWRIELRLLIETASLLTRIPASAVRVVSVAVLRILFLIVESVILSAAVQLALSVPMVAYFHLFSLTGMAANLLVGFALTAAVPAGLLACSTAWKATISLTSGLVHFARENAAYWASLEPGFRVPDPPVWLALTCIGTCLAFAAALRMARSRVSLAAAAFCSVSATVLLIVAPFPPDLGGEFEITGIDVGQGDSLFVTSPEGGTLLLDAGGVVVFDDRTAPRLDIGEDVVSPYLWRRRLKRLDAVAITHLHEDHAGGMARVIRNFHPAELWIGAVVEERVWHRIREAALASGTRIRHLQAGDTPMLGSIPLKVLSPARAYEPGEAARNNDSLVLLVQHGRHRFLLTGDAEARTEEQLLAQGALPEVDVLKVGHHGSRTSTGDPLIAAIRPLFAIISAGEDNPYGHPHPLTLQRLTAAGVRVRRTDQNGLVSFRSDGKRLTIFPTMP